MADTAFIDPSAVLATNPYLSLPPIEKPHWSQTIGTMLANLGAGISGATSAGQPWSAGIAPGAAMASAALARSQKEQEADALRRFHLGISLQGLQDKQAERRLKLQGMQAWSNANDPDRTAAPGFDLKPNPIDMAPKDLKTAGAPLVDYMVRKHGLSPVAAATVIGNLGWESPGFNTTQAHDGGRGYGLAGWDPQRTAGLQAFAAQQGKPASDMQTQLDYVMQEMKGGDMGAQRAYAMLQSAKTPEDATTAMMHFFRPAGYTPANPAAGHGFQGRVANARALVPGGPQPVIGDMPPSIVALGTDAAPMPDATAGTLPGGPPPVAMPEPRLAQNGGVIPQGGNDVMTTPTPAPGVLRTPAPAVPPPEPPQVPKPMLPRDEAKRLVQAVNTGQMTAKEAEAEKLKIIGDLWKDQKEQAARRYQQQLDLYKVNRTQELQAGKWRAATEEEKRQAGVRPNVPMQVNTLNGEMRAMPGSSDKDISMHYQTPEVQKLINALPPAERAGFDAAAALGDHRGANAILVKAQTGIPEENQGLSGDDFLKTLPVGDQQIVRGLVDGSILPSDLSRRDSGGSGFNRYLMLAKQADPSWSPGEGGARRAFETKYMVTGQGGQTIAAANTALHHMRTYRDLVANLNNTASPLFNTAMNEVKRQFGDADVPSAEAARNLLAVELAKAAHGAGAVSLEESTRMRNDLSNNASPGASQKTLDTLYDMMMGRVHTLEDMAKARGVPDKQIEGYLSPRAREAADYVKNNPIGKKAPPAAPPKDRQPLDQIFGTAAPGMTVAPPGTIPARPPLDQIFGAPQ